MKKIILTISLIAALPMVNSCSDAYDIVQAGEFSEDATFKTQEDMQLYLNIVYDKINIIGEIEFSSILTDELGIGNQNGGQNVGLYRFILNPSSGAYVNSVNGIWLGHYAAINSANRLIEGAKKVAVTDQAKYNSIIAQARAIRAFCHFQLLSFFATDLKNDAGLGVLLSTDIPLVSAERERSTVGEVFDAVNGDLDFAEANLGSPVIGQIKAYKFISKNMINALRARINAYRGKYTEAETFANKVIASSGLTLTLATPIPTEVLGSAEWNTEFYGKDSPSPYRRMFADAEQGEVIFALDRPAGKSRIGSIYYFNQTNLTGGAFMDMGRNLFNILDANKNNDIRRWAYVDPTSKVDPQYLTNSNYRSDDVLLIDKYPGRVGTAGQELLNDLKVFRLSEMYLIKAEARAAAGDFVGVATALKAVRDARSIAGPTVLATYSNTEGAWKDILKERRIELSFEGHRYVDLKRLGALAGEKIDRNVKDSEGLPEATMDVTDHRFTLPIPQSELNANKVISQNPGY